MRPRAPVLSSSRRDWLVTLVWGACMIMTMVLLPIAVLALALNGTAQLCAGPSSCDRIVAHFPGEKQGRACPHLPLMLLPPTHRGVDDGDIPGPAAPR